MTELMPSLCNDCVARNQCGKDDVKMCISYTKEIKIKCDDCKFVEDCVDYGWEGCKKFTPTQKKRHTQETTELKPCPFCGGKAEVWVSDVTDRAIVYCTVCDAQIGIKQNEQEAIEAWNKRVPCDTCAMYFPNDGCMAGLADGEVME